MTRFLALTLLIVFFAFLPSASADGDNGLIIKTPNAHQTASNGTAMLTLNASNIQVRAKWRLDGDSPFAITDNGELRLTAELSDPTTIVATVIVEDMFSELNRNYQNLAATALITVEFMFGTLRIVNPPARLLAAFGMGGTMAFHTSGGMGEHTFRLYSASDYFTLGKTSGILSVAASVAVGQYAITVEVRDETATLFITVIAEVEAADNLILANAPPLAATVIAGVALSLHTFTASGGLGTLTYALIGNHAGHFYALIDNHAGHFSIDERDGVLRIHGDRKGGVYTLSVEVSDGAIIPQRATAEATIAVVEILFLADAPPLTATAGTVVLLHTFTASGGLGAKTYALIAGNADYFSIGDNSGVLQMNGGTIEGIYTLSVEVSDGLVAPQRATAKVTVEVKRKIILSTKNALTLTAKVSDRKSNIYTYQHANEYHIVAGNVGGYFSIGETSGMLSSQAPVGIYTIGIELTYVYSLPNSPSIKSLSVVVVEVIYSPVPTKSAIYVLGGYDGSRRNDVWSSVDGKTWVEETANAAWSERYDHQSVLHNGRLYVLGGYDGSRLNDVWSSVNGINWSLETDSAGWSRRNGHQALSHNGRLYVLGGQDGIRRLNDVWSSVDGKSWRQEEADNSAGWSNSYDHQALLHNGRLYVLGGNGGFGNLYSVASSADGKSWRQERAYNSVGWSARQDHQALSHNGRLYVLGGNDGSRLNDVWSSIEGINWMLVKTNNNAGWSRRYDHQALLHNGQIYVLGGDSNNGRLNDVWSSAEGINWTLVKTNSNAGWSRRYGHQAVVFPQLQLSGFFDVPIFPNGHLGVLHILVASGGSGEYTYTLSPSGSGFVIDANGVLSADGTAATGEHIITVQVADGDGQTAIWSGKVIIICPGCKKQ